MLTVEVEQEADGRWLAEVTELPGVTAYGQHRDEAVSRAQALALRVLAERVERGEPATEIRKLFAVWSSPWRSIDHLPDQTHGMERELDRELAPGHQLYGLPVRAVGSRQDCDDVLFALEDGSGRFALVHLTWTSNPPDQPPWPHTVVYPSFDAWVAKTI